MKSVIVRYPTKVRVRVSEGRAIVSAIDRTAP